jgi:hypothetical protein
LELLTFVTGDLLVRDVLSWLSPPGPWKGQGIPQEFCYEGTTNWFFQGNAFSKWKASSPGSLIWIYGKCVLFSDPYIFYQLISFHLIAGIGKGVIWYGKPLILSIWKLIILASSKIIHDIDAMQKAGLASLAFFSFNPEGNQKKIKHKLLSSLLTQLSYQSSTYHHLFFSFYSHQQIYMRLVNFWALFSPFLLVSKLTRPYKSKSTVKLTSSI